MEVVLHEVMSLPLGRAPGHEHPQVGHENTASRKPCTSYNTTHEADDNCVFTRKQTTVVLQRVHPMLETGSSSRCRLSVDRRLSGRGDEVWKEDCALKWDAAALGRRSLVHRYCHKR